MATKKNTKIEKAAKKVVKQAAKSVARKPTKDEAAVEAMSLHTTRSAKGKNTNVKGANLLSGGRNPSTARKEQKRMSGSSKKAKGKK